MKTFHPIHFFILVFFSMGCSSGGSGGGTPSLASPGKFSLVSMNTPASHVSLAARVLPGEMHSASRSANAVEINVGDLRSTQSYFFLLKNVGETDITDIVLSSSDTYVQIVPSRIDRLPPDAQSDFSPIIKVTIEHGIRSNGVGLAATIPMGAATANVLVTGTTTASGTTTLVDPLDVGINFVSRVANYVLFNVETDEETPWSSCTWSLTTSTDGWISVCEKSDDVSVSQLSSTDAIITRWGIRNTGNVELKVSGYRLQYDAPSELTVETTLPIGATLDLLMYDNPYATDNKYTSRWIIDSQGALFSELTMRDNYNIPKQYLEINLRELLQISNMTVNQ